MNLTNLMLMKRIFLGLLFFLTATITCISQDYQDVVYLKNGNIIRGSIIELIPDDYLDIRTTNGRVRSIDMYDVERIVKERVRTESETRNSTRPSQNAQYDNRYSQNNNRVIQNYNQNNSRNIYNDYNYYDDSYYYPQKYVYTGLKGGVNVSNMAIEEAGNKLGLQGGVFAEFIFNNFAIQPELLFSMQGAKFSEVENGISNNAFLKNNYVNIPLMAKYYIFDGFCIEAGPQLGLLLSAKVKVKVSGRSKPETGNYKSMLNNFDFSFNLGASYLIPNTPLGFYVRYSLGITDIIKDKYVDFGEIAGNNRVFQAGTFVKF